jgi:hypothetical protein
MPGNGQTPWKHRSRIGKYPHCHGFIYYEENVYGKFKKADPKRPPRFRKG